MHFSGRTIVALLATLALLAMVGCGGDDDSNSATDASLIDRIAWVSEQVDARGWYPIGA